MSIASIVTGNVSYLDNYLAYHINLLATLLLNYLNYDEIHCYWATNTPSINYYSTVHHIAITVMIHWVQSCTESGHWTHVWIQYWYVLSWTWTETKG